MENSQALLLMAYGTPGSIGDIETYYTDVRRGRPPDARQLRELQDRYTAIGGKTPLLDITLEQAKLLEERIGIKTYVGMKHWHPYIKDTVKKIAHSGATEIIALVLAPHYSSMSVADYSNRLHQAITEVDPHIRITLIKRWGDNPIFIDSLCERMVTTLQEFSSPKWADISVLFSAHSLPTHILQAGDPYSDELTQTSRLAASKLNLPKWKLVFQSAGKTSDNWIGPDILAVLPKLAREGSRQVLIAPIGFTTDNLEILYDLDIQAAKFAKKLGLSFKRIHTANASLRFIDALEDVIGALVSQQ